MKWNRRVTGPPAGRDAPSFSIAPHREGGPLHLALSGGGVRSACFAAGALFALVEHGHLHRIRTISSTSGGSLVNAIAARALSASPTPDRSRNLLNSLAYVPIALSRFELSPYRSHARSVIGAAMVATLLMGVASLFFSVTWRAALPALALAPVVSLLFVLNRDFRGLSVDTINALVASCCGEFGTFYEATECSDSSAIHVFVACDLSNGSEVFFRTGKEMFEVLVADRERVERFHSSLAGVVLHTMRFPGYTAVGRVALGKTRIPVIDGGLVDNNAVTYFLLQSDTVTPSTILAIAATKSGSPLRSLTASGEFSVRDRLEILKKSISVLHQHLAEAPLRTLERDENRKLVRVEPLEDLRLPTSLRRLRRKKAESVFNEGRKAMGQALLKGL